MTRGRSPGFVMSDEHRVKIKNSNILNALIEHVEGTREMSATQVSAGVALLRKVMPDLAASAVAPADSKEGKQILGWLDDGDEDTVQAEAEVQTVPQQD